MNSNTLSAAQIAFLQAHKRRKIRIHLYRIGILILFLFFWEFSTYKGWVDDFIFSSPSKLMLCCYRMIRENQLFFHIGVTLFETIVSFILVMVLSLIITILLWYSKSLTETLDPYLVVLNSLPKSALAPLLIVWLGANYKTIILTGMSVAIFGTILNLYIGFQEVDAEKIKLIRTLGGNQSQILTKVVLPANASNLIGLMKVNIGLCLVGVIIGEFISSKCGLGYLIIYGSQVFKLDWVILSILILCCIAILLYSLIGLLERRQKKNM
ncbi:MAG: ABC transporter permease [Butyrivibrio sp.]|nr:ABC transporter permease [Roseburia sp.]MCM1561845.1 ABC transporter permease [Butyrivibrio sp.]